MYPISSDLVRAMDDERRSRLRRGVRRRRRREDEAAPPRPRLPVVWVGPAGEEHHLDADGVARVRDRAPVPASRRSG